MNKVYKYVTDNAIKQLEEAIKTGDCPFWRKPWLNGLPKNYITRIPYKGINLATLPRDCTEYITFNQIKKLQNSKKYNNISLKKGSKSHMIVFWNFKKYKKEIEENGEIKKKEKTIPMLRYYNVFKITDVENLPSKEELKENQKILDAEEIVNLSECQIVHNDNTRAYYKPGLDYINVPNINLFTSSNEYYSTLFHEMIHSSGHKNRLDRFETDSYFGNENYSKEELIAEMGANILCSYAKINNENLEKNSVAYLRSWINVLKDDIKMAVLAAGKAHKAVDYILKNKISLEEAV